MWHGAAHDAIALQTPRGQPAEKILKKFPDFS